jgi:hypothetical protein
MAIVVARKKLGQHGKMGREKESRKGELETRPMPCALNVPARFSPEAAWYKVVKVNKR